MWSKKNKEAVVSSLLVGVGFGVFWGALVYISPSSNASPLLTGVVMGLIGFATGLLTTWYTEE